MKNWVFAFGILMCLGACKDKQSQSQSIENKIVEKIIDWNLYIDKFKFKNLKSFELKEDSIERSLVKIDNDLFYKVTQDSFSFDNCYFYSFQGQDTDYYRLTIFHQSEAWSTNLIWYLIYDKNGKLISKTAVAEDGSEEDWALNLKSKFINDSTLIIDSDENRFGEIDDSEMKNIKLQKEIIFQDNGRTKERLISKAEKIIKVEH